MNVTLGLLLLEVKCFAEWNLYFVHFRLQSWTQTLLVCSATLGTTTSKWQMILTAHEDAIRRPLRWTTMMQSLEPPQWTSV